MRKKTKKNNDCQLIYNPNIISGYFHEIFSLMRDDVLLANFINIISFEYSFLPRVFAVKSVNPFLASDPAGNSSLVSSPEASEHTGSGPKS